MHTDTDYLCSLAEGLEKWFNSVVWEREGRENDHVNIVPTWLSVCAGQWNPPDFPLPSLASVLLAGLNLRHAPHPMLSTLELHWHCAPICHRALAPPSPLPSALQLVATPILPFRSQLQVTSSEKPSLNVLARLVTTITFPPLLSLYACHCLKFS